MSETPEGFVLYDRSSPVTKPWEPLYIRPQPRAVHVGLRLRQEHCNGRGLIHGGVIAALADNAMGMSLYAAMSADGLADSARIPVTVGLSVDYIGTGKIGQWMQIEPRVVKSARTLGFVDALITADGAPVARANATFKIG